MEEDLPQIKGVYTKLRKVMRHRYGGPVGAAESNRGEVESQPGRDPAFGRFQLNEQFNADQVGLAFVNGLETTFNEKGVSKRGDLSQPVAGLDKRQYTVNIFINPGAKLMRPAIIFRRSIFSAVEKPAYYPPVDIFSQANA